MAIRSCVLSVRSTARDLSRLKNLAYVAVCVGNTWLCALCALSPLSALCLCLSRLMLSLLSGLVVSTGLSVERI